jgi:hypothetical protein
VKLVPADVARLAVKFIYHSVRNNNITVEENQIEDLLKIADFLQFEDLKSACDRRMTSYSLNAENCLKMLQFAETYNAKSLCDKSRQMILSNFLKFDTGEEILKVTAEFLVSMMSDDALSHVSADRLYKLMRKWLKVSSDRLEHLPELFACIDLKDFSMNMWEKVCKSTSLLNNAYTKKLIYNHRKLIESGSFDPSAEEKDVILVAGGVGTFFSDDDAADTCLAYVIEDDKWCDIQRLPRRLVGGLAVLSGDAYFCGTKSDGVNTGHHSYSYKLSKNDIKKHWEFIQEPWVQTDEVFCCIFSDEGKLISVRAHFQDVFIEVYDPQKSPTETSQHYNLLRIDGYNELACNSSASMVCVKEFIGVHLKINNKRFHPRVKETCRQRFYIFNSKTGEVSDHSSTTRSDVMYAIDNKIHLETPGQKNSHVFDVEKRKWSNCRRGLPAFPADRNLVGYSVVIHNNDLFLYGKIEEENGSPALYKLSRSGYTWHAMTPPSSKNPNSRIACAIMKLPKKYVRCSMKANCQICRSLIARNYVDEESDDDDESNIFMDTDSYMSDSSWYL